jgi:hypothetical protein
MTFTEELLSGVKGAEYCRIRKKRGYVTGAAKFPASEYSRVLEHVEEKLEPILRNGEKILCSLEEGEIIDCGVRQFRVKKGTFMEVYDYSRAAVMFIRLYLISDGAGEWLALYVDENPSTPWWEKKKEGVTP